MVQLLINDKVERDTIKLMKSREDGNYTSKRDFVENFDRSTNLGEALYDSGFLGAFYILDRDFFISNYKSIFNFLANAGTCESYISFFKSLFGNDTTIEFEFIDQTPGVVKIKVFANLEAKNLIDSDDNYLVDNNNKNITAVTDYGGNTEAQLRACLGLLTPYGMILDLNIQ